MEFSALTRRTCAVLTALGLALVLAGCMFAPGKFVSELDLRKDGGFTFHYQGELYVLGLSDFANKQASASFTASCWHQGYQ